MVHNCDNPSMAIVIGWLQVLSLISAVERSEKLEVLVQTLIKHGNCHPDLNKLCNCIKIVWLNPIFRRACGHGDMSTPSFDSHINPISTRGADYAHPILVFTPCFESQRRAWFWMSFGLSGVGLTLRVKYLDLQIPFGFVGPILQAYLLLP